uniref:Uncharacterized protein n=1 Tax=Rhizophora mucronata TaxID=61149 RepID=A0A2P2R571_RHIMU
MRILFYSIKENQEGLNKDKSKH